MDFTIVNSKEFTFRKYENMKMAIWHITTHFVVEGHIQTTKLCDQAKERSDRVKSECPPPAKLDWNSSLQASSKIRFVSGRPKTEMHNTDC